MKNIDSFVQISTISRDLNIQIHFESFFRLKFSPNCPKITKRGQILRCIFFKHFESVEFRRYKNCNLHVLRFPIFFYLCIDWNQVRKNSLCCSFVCLVWENVNSPLSCAESASFKKANYFGLKKMYKGLFMASEQILWRGYMYWINICNFRSQKCLQPNWWCFYDLPRIWWKN